MLASINRTNLRLVLALCFSVSIAACESTEDSQSPQPAPAPADKSASRVEVGPAEPLTKTELDRQTAEEEIGRALKSAEQYHGSGVLARSNPIEPQESILSDQGKISLNFVDADVGEVIDVVLGDILGVNYVVDPEVQGLVTLRTAEALPRNAVLPTLESILRINGIVLVERDDVYSILPASKAPATYSNLGSEAYQGQVRGHSVQVYPLRYATASAVYQILQPFLGPDQRVVVDDARNVLIFSGTTQELRDLQELAGVFDVDWMKGMSFALLPVEMTDSVTMATEMQTVFGEGLGGPSQGMIRFVPIERLNAVLAISPQASYLKQAELWIERLDRRDQRAGRQIFVYYVKNGRAVELAEILSQVFADTPRRLEAEFLAPGVAAVTLGEAPQLAEAPGGPDAVDAGRPVPLPPVGFAGESLAGGGGIQVGSLVEEGAGVNIIADERNNALVILATSSEFEMIEAALDRLDIIPLQVLIEATIAEVRLNDTLEYGLQWFFGNGDVSGSFSNGLTNAILPAFPGFNFVVDTANVRAVLSALTEITEVRVISSPQLMVLDNQTARLQVGDQVPIATRSSTQTSDPDAPIVNDIELRDTGVILEVTPRINASGLVVLDVVQEVSEVTQTTTSDIDSPTIQQRKIESTVAVESGNTIALGGLIRDRTEDSTSGIPLLSDIPILGNLFKSNAELQQRTELLVLITPQVVRNAMESREVTEELRRRLSTVLPLEQEIQ